ncbi:MAG: lytic transglycosylase domain-containing protein, partial [Alphaproteobacteria bacterium]|nr:lytic transglycosylase domain-containing protein [Alphaproteobacteria bacterium]
MNRRDFTRGLVLMASLPALSGVPAMAAFVPEPSALAIEAAKLALAGNFIDAGATAARSGDEAAIKLVELIYLRDRPKDAGHGRIMDFLVSAPGWPLQESLLKRAERALYANKEPAPAILDHFAKRKPLTAEGQLALARAKLAGGDREGAARLITNVWTDPETEAALAKEVQAEFKSMIGEEAKRRRLWRLIFAQETNAAIRAASGLGAAYQNAAKVAQKLIRGIAKADKEYAKLPAEMRQRMAMRYALARFHRKYDKWEKTREVLLTIPADAAENGDGKAWWVERRITARHSVGPGRKGSFKAAYQIASAHGFSSGEEAIEGEFLAGWIALRSLDNASLALGHFETLAGLASNGTEKARARYWQGRSLMRLGRAEEAKAAYRKAAEHSTVYYGQLAREAIGLGKVPEDISNGLSTPAAQKRVARDEVVRAFQIMRRAGSRDDLGMFLWALAGRFESVDEMNAVADLVSDAGGATMALRLAKASAQRGVDIDHWNYPIRALPNWQQIGKPVEKALVFGLARQESEFNPTAGSVAGAQGLMQIMPNTAKLIARQYGLKYKKGILTSDPAYNVKLGAAHLGDLVEDFGGSYVLTLVAYNAGPRRSVEWVDEYGDLRDGRTDPIDWVESIPFQETRQYVQKVLQNIHVYRSRLAPKTVRPMTADLARGAVQPFKLAASDERAVPACGGR